MGNCCGYCCGSCCDGLRKLARRIKPKVHPTSDPVEESTKEDLGKKASWPNTSRVAPEPCGGDALEEDMDPIKGDSAGGTPLAMVTPSTTSESDQAMTMPTVVRKEDDFAGCEDSDP